MLLHKVTKYKSTSLADFPALPNNNQAFVKDKNDFMPLLCSKIIQDCFHRERICSNAIHVT